MDAATVLLKREGPTSIPAILSAAREMSEQELEALSEEMVASAPDIEDALIEALDDAGAAACYLCGFALASIPSQRALPKLLDVMQDPERAKEPRLFAETLVSYGDELLDTVLPRIAEIKKPKTDDPLVILLREYASVAGDKVLKRARKVAPRVVRFLR